jgi:hypothetical protein
MLTGHSNHTTEAARKSRASTIHFSAGLRLFHKATSPTTGRTSPMCISTLRDEVPAFTRMRFLMQWSLHCESTCICGLTTARP